MGKIQILEEQTINQIAAGEVVENPASVVKELVDNAIDAGAAHIEIEIKGGGFLLIRVSDDGCGMDAEDAKLSLQRHATSKIRSSKDLHEIATMGFRGEALASISSISKLTLITAEEGKTGIKIDGEEVSPSARNRGTTTEVRSLFYNVPVRKKFQKSSAASLVEIQRVVMALSLANPHVGFELQSQGKQIFLFSPKVELKDRIADVLGKEFLNSAKMVRADGIEGFIASPSNSRHNRQGQFLCINRRPVFSLPLSFAMRDAFGTRIDPDRHPQFVLHLEIDPHLVDVNVHPQKKEVRLQKEEEIKKKLREAVVQSFTPHRVPTETLSSIFSFPPLELREEAVLEEWSLPLKKEVEVVGLFEHYLLVNEDGLLLVDLLAAKEKIALDAIESGNVASQGLLVPVTIDIALPEECLGDLEKVGVLIRPLGKTTFVLDAIPPFLEVEDVKDLIYRVVAGDEVKKSAGSLARGRKRRFMLQEALAILERLWEIKGSYMNVIIHMSRDELAKLFR